MSIKIDNKISRFRGDTYDETIVIMEGDSILDISDCTVELTIDYDTPLVIPGTITDAVKGVVTFPFVENNVDKVGLYKYDVQVVYVGGKKGTHIKDWFKLKDDVNKG